MWKSTYRRRSFTARANSESVLQINTIAVLHQLTPGQTYWSVQAVDSGFVGSAFGAEQQFNIGTSAPRIASLRHANGDFELAFSSTPEANFVVLASTNLSLSLSNWAVLSTPNESSPGQFQFIDSQAPQHLQRFYRVLSQ